MKGLYALKPWYTRRLNGVVDYAVSHRLSPDVFTAAGVLAAAGAAVWAARQTGPGLHWLSWPVLWVLGAALAATLPTFASLAAAGAGAAPLRVTTCGSPRPLTPNATVALAAGSVQSVG